MSAMKITGVLVLLLALFAGCGGGNDEAQTDDPSPSGADDITVSGNLHASISFGFKIKRNPDHCVADGKTTTPLLTPGAQSVVISDPDGTQVALGEIHMGWAPTYTDDGEEYYNTDVCNFPFLATGVPRVEGVYTASIPELGVEARFTAGGASDVKLRFDH